MMATEAPVLRPPTMQMLLAGELTEIDLEALQRLWSEEQYLRLTQQTKRLLEFTVREGFAFGQAAACGN